MGSHRSLKEYFQEWSTVSNAEEKASVKITENIHSIYLYIVFGDPDESNSGRIMAEKTRWQWVKE